MGDVSLAHDDDAGCRLLVRRALLTLALTLVLAVAAPVARAATTYPAINALLSEAIQRPVQAACYTPEEWLGLGAQNGFDPNGVLGFVISRSADGGVTWWPDPVSHNAPGICERTEAFRLSPTRETQKLCQEGVTQVPRTEYRLVERVRTVTKVKYVPSRRWVTLIQNGKRVRVLRPYKKRVEYKVRVTYTVEVPYTVYEEVPRLVTCIDWAEKTLALHVILHEAGHMAGIRDERQDDCWAMQNLDWFAWRLGALPTFASEIQSDEWAWYSTHQYFDPACVRG